MRRLLAALGVVGLLVGCSTIPESGPVEFGGPGQIADAQVEIAPEPPRAGADPGHIVDGFLQAMANSERGFAVAREYLAADVAQEWQPDERITVYADSARVVAGAETAELIADVVGRVGPDGAYTAVGALPPEDQRLRHNFEMRRDGGEWRIGNPPAGRLVQTYLFNRFFESASIYFFDTDYRTLVPDQVFVPRDRTDPLGRLRALFRGPTQWLAPAVQTAIPAGTQLNVQSATRNPDGVVDVSMSGSDLLGLGAEQRTRIRDQIVATLSDDGGAVGVRLTVEGAPFAVDGADAGGVVRLGGDAADPIPAELGEQLFGLSGDAVVRVDDQRSEAVLAPVVGPWGDEAGELGAISPSLTGDRVAGVLESGRELWQVRVQTGEPQRLLTGDKLLRPQYVGGGGRDELWTIDADAGLVHRVLGTERTQIEAPGLRGVRVRAFRLSPDGSRLAVVGERAGRVELGLLWVRRGAEPLIDGWRVLPIGGRGDQAEPVDVSWVSEESLMVLAKPGKPEQVRPWRVSVDGADVAQLGTDEDWSAETITALPRHRNPRVVVLGPSGAWSYTDDASWRRIAKDLRAISFAG